MAVTFQSIVPVLRIFDVAKADEFYQGFLGFSVDWDHRFDDNAPLYRQISKGSLIIHLTEHHGDCSPGTQIRVNMSGLEEYHRELNEKKYRYMKPGIEDTFYGMQEMCIVDPFGNQIKFYQPQGGERPAS